MSRIDKETIIEAPLETVFNYVSNPENLLEIWPGLLLVSNITPLEAGGYRLEYEYKMAGMRFKGKGEFSEFIRNRWFVVQTRGVSRSTITCTFRTMHGEDATPLTRITLTIEYGVPVPLLGNLAEYVIMKMNDQEADLVLANLRTRLAGTR